MATTVCLGSPGLLRNAEGCQTKDTHPLAGPTSRHMRLMSCAAKT